MALSWIQKSSLKLPKSHLSYRPDIDGLRAIDVVAVVLNHIAPEFLPGGFVGVDIFFVISGYLITGQLLNANANQELNLAEFYKKEYIESFQLWH